MPAYAWEVTTPEQTSVNPWLPWSMVPNAIAESVPRAWIASASLGGAGTGVLTMVGNLVVPAGRLVSNMTMYSSTTAAVGQTNLWFALVRQSDNVVLAQTADNLDKGALGAAGGWANNSLLTLAYTTPWRAPSDTPVYGCLLQVATTVTTLRGYASIAGTIGISPFTVTSSTQTGITTPASLTSPVAYTAGFGTGLPYVALS